MLKTNSKKVREAVKAFIIDNYGGEYFEDVNGKSAETFEEMARDILREMKRVEGFEVGRVYHGKRVTWQDAFEMWAETLPSGFSTESLYYNYTGSAVDIVGDILEQTETERNKYSDSEACHLMCYLIFRELEKVAFSVLR